MRPCSCCSLPSACLCDLCTQPLCSLHMYLFQDIVICPDCRDKVTQ